MALDVALIVIDSLCREMYSQDQMFLAFSIAARKKPKHISDKDYEKIINMVAQRAEKLRKSNPMSCLF